MKTETERLPKNGVKIKITVDAETVAQIRQHVISDLAGQTEVRGFRKGTAPHDLVEKSLDPAKIRGEIINHLVPQSYDQAIKETMIKPIMLPKIAINSFEEGGLLEFTAETCEAPDVQIGDYRSALNKLKTDNGDRPKTILGPDGAPLEKPNENDNHDDEDKTQKVLEAILMVCRVEICDLLIDEEVNNMLGRLIDQTGRLGLTVDQYLASVGKDAAALRSEYRAVAEKSLKLEFALAEIAKQENISVEEPEISATINSAPDEESRKSLSRTENLNYLKSILTKNKTIQKLLEYAK
ncbi:MAG: hypothetical protein M1352_00070 [Patescibacteria group bacterium]|nr:hypothetical protein [Patescibacteria group bacterium]